mgnify:FL=1
METVLIFWKGDKDVIHEYIATFRGFGDQELVDAYNREARMGIVGVHRQMLYLIALREVMKERFHHSPIYVESNIMGMQGEVQLVDGKLCFK